MFSKIVGCLAEKINPSITKQGSDADNKINKIGQPASSVNVEVSAKKDASPAPEAKPAVSLPKQNVPPPAPEKTASIARATPNLIPPVPDRATVESYIAFLKAHKLLYPLIFAVGMVGLYAAYRPAFVVLTFIGIGIASRLYQRFIRGLSLGVELIIFGAAITGKLYGAWPAALIGIVALPISVIYTEEDVKWLPVAMGGMILVGFLAVYLPPMSILMLGMILTLAYDLATCSVYLYVFHARFFTTAIFIASHLAFNYFIFSHFGETVLSLLA